MQNPTMASDAQNLRIRPRERRGDRTRARLVEAGLAEFREHGFERASIARIAKAAGVSRPTFYFHFPKKEDLLRELLHGIEDDVAERVTRTEGLREAVDLLIESVLEVQAQIGAEVLGEMLRAQTRLDPGDEDRPTEILDALAVRFREAAARGELRAGLDPGRVAAIYVASVFGCLLDPERAGRAEDLRALTSLFFRDATGEGAGGPS
jgi:AcrR family transcriptional regulator